MMRRLRINAIVVLLYFVDAANVILSGFFNKRSLISKILCSGKYLLFVIINIYLYLLNQVILINKVVAPGYARSNNL